MKESPTSTARLVCSTSFQLQPEFLESQVGQLQPAFSENQVCRTMEVGISQSKTVMFFENQLFQPHLIYFSIIFVTLYFIMPSRLSEILSVYDITELEK